MVWNYTFVRIFSLLIWPSYFQRGLGEKCLDYFNEERGEEGVGALVSLGLSMIGR